MSEDVKEVNLDKWAKITIQRWQYRMAQLKIYDQDASDASHVHLTNSLIHQLSHDAGGNIDKITFTFHYYGYYVDAGVGRGYNHFASQGSRDKFGKLKFSEKDRKHRKERRWYNKVYWREFKKLEELIIKQYQDKTISIIKSVEG